MIPKYLLFISDLLEDVDRYIWGQQVLDFDAEDAGRRLEAVW